MLICCRRKKYIKLIPISFYDGQRVHNNSADIRSFIMTKELRTQCKAQKNTRRVEAIESSLEHNDLG